MSRFEVAAALVGAAAGAALFTAFAVVMWHEWRNRDA